MSDKENKNEEMKNESVEEKMDEEPATEEADSTDSEIEELKNEISELEDQTMRLQAEIQNLQRRHKKNREESARYRSQKLAEAIIPVVDNLERVLQVEVETEEGESMKKGVEMVLNSFYTAFKDESIEVIDPLGKEFDPNYHEALTLMPADDDHPAGTIAQVFQKGYILNDRVLRAAGVAIYQ